MIQKLAQHSGLHLKSHIYMINSNRIVQNIDLAQSVQQKFQGRWRFEFSPLVDL